MDRGAGGAGRTPRRRAAALFAALVFAGIAGATTQPGTGPSTGPTVPLTGGPAGAMAIEPVTSDAIPVVRGEVGPPGPHTLGRGSWMRRLRPGERPPQFVLFSFDGAGSHAHWQRVLAIAERSRAHVTGFLSGIYLLPDEQRAGYRGPGHPPGRASIRFGGSAEEVAVRIADLNLALAAGHEIGTHYNGHFCRGAEPAVGTWTTAMWNDELDQFLEFVRRAPALRLRPADVRGGRTPCLEGRWDQVVPAMLQHGFRYDTSRPSREPIWPTHEHGIWEFWMPMGTVPALNRRVLLMDYNLWAAFNGVRDEPARAGEFAEKALAAYRLVYRTTIAGNRAPLVLGNHFNDWSGGGFSLAIERFIAEVCPAPETVCATYSEVIDWMRMQDPEVLASLQTARS